MAFNVSPDAQLVFFDKVFGSSHPLVQTVKNLVAAGVTFNTSLFDVKATYKGTEHKLTLAIGITALMKGTAPHDLQTLNKQKVWDWLTKLEHEIQPEPVANVVLLYPTKFPGNVILSIKAVRALTQWGLNKAKTYVENTNAGQVQAPLSVSLPNAAQAAKTLQAVSVQGYATYANQTYTFPALAQATFTTTTGGPLTVDVFEPVVAVTPEPTKKAPTTTAIALKDSDVIGQPVRGTSPGSVYYTVATSPTVRLAARIHSQGSVSIRAEWPGTLSQTDEQKLTTLGLSVKGNYASTHLVAGSVGAAKVIGAFLLGSNIEWTEIVKASADLHTENS